jgi:hypothetical protein
MIMVMSFDGRYLIGVVALVSGRIDRYDGYPAVQRVYGGVLFLKRHPILSVGVEQLLPL